MSIVQNTASVRPRRWIVVPDEPRPSRSSRQLIELAEQACRTGQPNLALLYLRRADVASDCERLDRYLSLAVFRYGGLAGHLVAAFRPVTEVVEAAFAKFFDALGGAFAGVLAGPGDAS